MAEKLKELYKGTFKLKDFYDNSNNIQLYTTDATTQNVIKSISSDKAQYQFDVKVNGFNIYSGIGSATGQEIVDTNSTVTTSLTDIGYFDTLGSIQPVCFAYGTDYIFTTTAENITSVNAENPAVTSLTLDQSDYVALDTFAHDYIQASDGDTFIVQTEHGNPYYGYLFKHSGSLTGTRTQLTLPSNGYYVPLAIDHDNACIYYINGSTLYKFDIETEVETTVAVTGSFGVKGSAAYNKLFVANNKLFWSRNGGYVDVIDLDTFVSVENPGNMANLSSYVSGSPSYQYQFGYYNGKYYLLYANNSTISYKVFEEDFSQSLTSSFTVNEYTAVYNALKFENLGKYLFRQTSAWDFIVIDLESIVADTFDYAVLDISQSYYDSYYDDSQLFLNIKALQDSPTAVQDKIFGEVDLRITGVEITEVN